MSERFDLCGPIHKALRARSAQLLVALGATDWRSAAASTAMLDDLTAYLALARAHLLHEDAEIHPVLHGIAEAVGVALDAEHDHHHAGFAERDDAIAAVTHAGDAARPKAGHALYLRFARHFAEDLLHMDREETVAQRLLQQRYDDAALQAIEHRILAAIPPEQGETYQRMLLPALSPAERSAMLRGMAAGAPPEVYAHVRDVVARDCLAPVDHALLLAELAVPA